MSGERTRLVRITTERLENVRNCRSSERNAIEIRNNRKESAKERVNRRKKTLSTCNVSPPIEQHLLIHSIKIHRSEPTKKWTVDDGGGNENVNQTYTRGQDGRTTRLDVEIFLQHLLQRTVFELVRFGDQVEVSDVRLVGRRRYGVAQQRSDPAVNPIASPDTIQREPHLGDVM